MGGVLEFAAFAGADGTLDDIASGVALALAGIAHVDQAAFRAMDPRRISAREFLGDWFDADRQVLVKLGTWRTDDGAEFHNPSLLSLENKNIVSGGGAIPRMEGGQFAYAFAEPPYGLRAGPRDVQALFDEIRAFILPANHEADVFDWSSDRLVEVSPYFEAGMEWWGVFLFSVHVPALRRLTIIAASSTD